VTTARGGSFDPAAYDAWFQTPVGRLTDQLEHEAVRALLPEPVGIALDLSCGTDNYALDLAECGWRVVGIDLAPVMLAEARRKAAARHSSACFVAGDAAALPLRDHSIRLVTFILGLEFMPEPLRALREVSRVLQPAGGIVIVAILAPSGAWTRWRRLKRRFVDSVWQRASFRSEATIRQAAETAGLRLVGRRAAVYYVPTPTPVRWLEWWERTARRRFPALATFVALRFEPEPRRDPHAPGESAGLSPPGWEGPITCGVPRWRQQGRGRL
jgi:ubiquinone/menaquinone biosynthesis C-methylase UbiE